MFHRHSRPRVVLLDSTLGGMPFESSFDYRHYRPRFGRRLVRLALFAGFVFLLFRFWYVPAALIAAFATRRLYRSWRRSRRVVTTPPAHVVKAPDAVDQKVQAELDALEERFK